jgi:hypothetical protein
MLGSEENRSSKHPARTHLETLKPGVASAELFEEKEAVLGAADPHVPVQHRHQPLLAAARPFQQRARQLCGLVRLFRRSSCAPPFAPGRGGVPRVALRPRGRRAWAGEHCVRLDDAQGYCPIGLSGLW